jgi:NAD(P)-dependent dehydrogenase (short-subunit alcohol dehydrogenase family)
MEKTAKLAVVTGGNRGIGFEICRQLKREGMDVIMTSRDPKKGIKAREQLKQEGLEVEFHVMDMSSYASIDQFFQILTDHHGKLDILINNAGIHYDSYQHASDADMKIVLEALDINLIGPWHACQRAIPLMKRNGYGRIVNVSSGAGSLTEMKGGTPAYSVSKAGLNVLTIKLAHELRSAGIKVNAVCPGWVKTDMGGPQAPRSVEKGASGIVWAAMLPSDGPSGGFFRDGKPIPW